MTTEARMPNAECRAACRHGASGLGQALGAGASCLVTGLLTVLIRAYQLTLSPAQSFLFGAAAGCRYTPTCSVYAVEALREHGAMTGTALAARRICRCHPWGGCGPDPVPTAESRGRRL